MENFNLNNPEDKKLSPEPAEKTAAVTLTAEEIIREMDAAAVKPDEAPSVEEKSSDAVSEVETAVEAPTEASADEEQPEIEPVQLTIDTQSQEIVSVPEADYICDDTTAPPKADTMAFTSLALGIAGVVSSCFCGLFNFICGIIAIVFGILVRRKKLQGANMALVGIICGVISIVLGIIIVIMNIRKAMTIGLFDDVSSALYIIR